jgi:hypothetical protein
MTIAKGRCESEPIPCDMAAGSNPRVAISMVISDARLRGDSEEGQKPTPEDTLKLVCVTSSAGKPPIRAGITFNQTRSRLLLWSYRREPDRPVLIPSIVFARFVAFRTAVCARAVRLFGLPGCCFPISPPGASTAANWMRNARDEGSSKCFTA